MQYESFCLLRNLGRAAYLKSFSQFFSHVFHIGVLTLEPTLVISVLRFALVAYSFVVPVVLDHSPSFFRAPGRDRTYCNFSGLCRFSS